MKINDPQIIQSTAAPKPASPNPQNTEGPHFKELLAQAVGGGRDTMPADKCTAAPLASAAKMVPIKPLTPGKSGHITRRVEGMLDALETYRQQLADRHQTLRGIEPIVKTIESRQQELSAALGQLDTADPLHGIVNELLVTASLEVVKFNRGDYN